MSNYPPGVTGYERQIAGSHEMDESLLVDECANVGELVVTVTRKGRSRRAQGLVCTFEGGAVEGVVYDHETFEWACPVCGHENDTDVSAEYSEPPERDYRDDYWD